jgi:hypothetical protein
MKTKIGLIILIVFSTASFSAGITMSPETDYQFRCMDENRSEAAEQGIYSNKTIQVDGEVTLDGQTVEEIDCSKFNQYSFPDPDVQTKGLTYPHPVIYITGLAVVLLTLGSIGLALKRSDLPSRPFGSIMGVTLVLNLLGALTQVYFYAINIVLPFKLLPYIGAVTTLSFLFVTPIMYIRDIRDKKSILIVSALVLTIIILINSLLAFFIHSTGTWIV